MNENPIHNALDSLTPTADTKQEILQDILSSTEKQSVKQSKKMIRSNKRKIAAAAVTFLVIGSAIGATAYANHFWGVHDLLIQNADQPTDAVPELSEDVNESLPENITVDDGQNLDNDNLEMPEEEEFNISSSAKKNYDLISVLGYAGTTEYQASKEWIDFESNYDRDGSVINSVGNSSNEYTEKYPLYYCYSKEMADMIESITTKYGLSLHQTFFDISSEEDLYTTAGTGDFVTDPRIPVYSAYCYDDGTLHFDSELALDSIPMVDFQFDRAKKGIFSQVCLNIGNASEYTETPYQCSNGANLTLALGSAKGLLLYDADDSFVVVNILCGTNSGLTLENLQEIAEMFDFTQIP